MVIPVVMVMGHWVPKSNFLWMVLHLYWVGRVYLLPPRLSDFGQGMTRDVRM